jgi:putative redox protein
MKVSATQSEPGRYTHRAAIRRHELTIDEPADQGGDDLGPTPQEMVAASLAGCMAITLEMYASRKQWDLGGPVEVEVEYDQAERGQPTSFTIVLRLPDNCTEEQVRRLREIASRCPVHRTLEGPATFEDRVELVSR